MAKKIRWFGRGTLLAAALALAACGEPQRIGTNVLFACTQPALDTTGWKRVPAPFPGYTILAPPSLQRSEDGADAIWQDRSRTVRVFRRPWGAAQFQDNSASRADYSSCWSRIAGMRVYLVVRRVEGGFQVTGWFRRPSSLPRSAGGLDGVVSGASPARADQAVFLQMIRSLQPAPAGR